MNTVSYNCPCCGASAHSSAEKAASWNAPPAATSYEPEALEMMNSPMKAATQITFANDAKRFDTGGGGHAGLSLQELRRRTDGG